MLAWANVSRPPPQPWTATYELLRDCLRRCNSITSPIELRESAEQVLTQEITLEFYVSILSRLHVNAFRCVPMLPQVDARP